ncbi:MAG: 5-oxoprolinase subunit PxpB [Candidatus Bathyarchaeota archaeon]|nr:5-oxoprolinase subunit PxpB [Candidatus Bathyarchaeota archaeon]
MNAGIYTAARYMPFGDNGLLIEFGDVISLEVNRRVIALSEAIIGAKIQGVEELVPTYRSLLVRYNASKISYEQLVFRIKDVEKTMEERSMEKVGRKIIIPVVYGGEYGPDLTDVARFHGLSEEQVVKIHSGREYRVYMVGFVAGFPYLGEVADEIATPRLETPRLKVPAGSVGIAEKQTGIYPCEAPGGWRIIGRTLLRLFNPLQQPPVLLQLGDIVKFKPISEKEFRITEKTSQKQPADRFPKNKKGIKVFQVLKPGFFTTVQDLGRYGYLRYGVPISGAMDTFSLVAANLLVANNPDDACLEITLIGPELQALTKTQIAITGGAASPKINGQHVPMWQTLEVQEGAVVSLGKVESGCRAYLSIRGGVDTPPVLGSRSTYVRGGFGGINGRQLKTEDIIGGFDVSLLKVGYSMPEELVPQFTGQFKARVMLGPQADMFTERGITTFLSSQYKVTLEADRMGYRLEGPIIEHKAKADIISDALLPGAVQIPKNGKPIMIMRDAQTAGGYPKIAVIITPDVSTLGQAKTNDIIEFSKITIQQAHEKISEYYKFLNILSEMLTKKS